MRANIVRKAENYRWSSAEAHCQLKEDEVLATTSTWGKQFDQINDWSAWLAEGDETEELTMIRRNIEKGLPCGTEKFIKKLEKRADRILQYRPLGRPKKETLK